MYRNLRNIGFDLPNATQNIFESRHVKTLASVLAAIAISGCVSQQSALDFGGTPIVQPVATGVSLGGSNLEPLSGGANAIGPTLASNVPVRAPRPSTSVASLPVAQPTVANLVEAGATSNAPTPVGTLAITETPGVTTPTANVIAEVTPATQTPSIAVPSPAPTTARAPAVAAATIASPAPSTVEVASLSPSVEAAPTLQPEVQTPKAVVVKKKTFFEKLFAPKESKPRPAASLNAPKIKKTVRASSRIETASSIADRPARSANKPKIKRPAKIVASIRARRDSDGTALPGVKSNAEIFGIKNEGANTSRTTRVAAVGSFGRLSPNGLRVQHSKVQVACLKPGVLRILKMVERRYGKKPIITSGYRSPRGNRRAGGARNSQHIFCKAVDIQVEGVSKWKLAKYLRTVPGRGGVGTYCRTKSVHIDIGSIRDWHHPCRKSSKRKRKKA